MELISDGPFAQRPLCTYKDIASGLISIDKESGIYGWYFDDTSFIPPEYTKHCIRHDNLTLLYVGKAEKSTTLFKRILGVHFGGTARNSTLRKSLGCLLHEELELTPYPKSKRFDFGEGETHLTEWMQQHAWVVWIPHQNPLLEETRIINVTIPPLSINNNPRNTFRRILRDERGKMMRLTYP